MAALLAMVRARGPEEEADSYRWAWSAMTACTVLALFASFLVPKDCMKQEIREPKEDEEGETESLLLTSK